MKSHIFPLRWMFVVGVLAAGGANLSGDSPWVSLVSGVTQPDTLEETISIAASMREEGKSRREIAQWVMKVVDHRLDNCNDPNPLEFCGVGRTIHLNTWRETVASTDNVTIARFAWQYRMGNCNENGNTVYYILREAVGRGDGGLRLVNSKDYHCFVVWGLDENAELNNPDTWGPEAFAADSWLGELVDPEGVKTRKWFQDNGTRPIVDVTDAADPEPADWERRQSERDRERRKTKSVEPCFVATAVYGTPMATEVQVLRDFRDQELRRYWAGRIFIRTYEEYGPILAAWLDEHEQLKQPVRQYIIGPVVDTLKFRRDQNVADGRR